MVQIVEEPSATHRPRWRAWRGQREQSSVPRPGLPSGARPEPRQHPELGVTAPALRKGQWGRSGPDPQHGALQVTEPRLLLTTRPRRPLGKMLREEMHEGKPSASCLDPTPGPGFPLPPAAASRVGSSRGAAGSPRTPESRVQSPPGAPRTAREATGRPGPSSNERRGLGSRAPSALSFRRARGRPSIFMAINFVKVGFTQGDENGPRYLLLVRNFTFLFPLSARLEAPNSSRGG